jgi:hypothetical protein
VVKPVATSIHAPDKTRRNPPYRRSCGTQRPEREMSRCHCFIVICYHLSFVLNKQNPRRSAALFRTQQVLHKLVTPDVLKQQDRVPTW